MARRPKPPNSLDGDHQRDYNPPVGIVIMIVVLVQPGSR
jgi:hypothetical protein